MNDPEKKIIELGLKLPNPIKLPPNLELPFSFINLRGNRALISGHPRQANDGSINGPYGQVGTDLTTEEAKLASKEIGLSILILELIRIKAQMNQMSLRSH